MFSHVSPTSHTDFVLVYTAQIYNYFLLNVKQEIMLSSVHCILSLCNTRRDVPVPFLYQVIDLGTEPITGSQYFGNGRVTEFKYGAKLGTVLRKWNGEKMAYLK